MKMVSRVIELLKMKVSVVRATTNCSKKVNHHSSAKDSTATAVAKTNNSDSLVSSQRSPTPQNLLSHRAIILKHYKINWRVGDMIRAVLLLAYKMSDPKPPKKKKAKIITSNY